MIDSNQILFQIQSRRGREQNNIRDNVFSRTSGTLNLAYAQKIFERKQECHRVVFFIFQLREKI